MPAYLVGWNPKESSFTDERFRAEFPDGPGDWSIGNRKAPPEPGSTFFFLRLGKEPKGIIGYGTISDEIDRRGHWRDDKYKRGQKETYVGLDFERIVNCLEDPECVLTLDILRHADLAHAHWTPQQALTKLKDDSDVRRLKQLFDELQGDGDPPQEPEGNDPHHRLFIEGGRRFVAARTTPARSRLLIKLKKQLVFEQTGRLACEVCDFDFALRYGGLGKGLIEGHHRKRISLRKKPGPSSLEDIALVCSNCHTVLETSGLTPEELRSRITLP